MNSIKKRFLFYLPSFQAGGAERQALNLAIELKNNYNVDVVLAAQLGAGPIQKECEELQIPNSVIPFDFYYFKYSKLNSFSYSKWKAYFKFAKQKRNFVDVVKAWKPDIIFSYCYEPNVIAGYFNNQYKSTKVIWNQRDVGTPPLVKNPIEKRAINNVFKIIGNSKAAENYVRSLYGNLNKLHFIPNGVSLKEATKIRSRSDFGFLSSDKVIGMIANYGPTKNHSALIEAFDKLKDPVFKILLMGRFTYEEKKKLNSLTIKKIEFHREDVSITAIIQLCDIIVHPSLSEGMPNAVLEAMYCERLILASNIEPHKEILGDDYKFLFDPNNSSEIEKLIMKGVSEENKGLIKANKKLVLENYSTKNLAKNYWKLINA